METLTSTVARVRAYCLKHRLLGHGTVVVAVSGGADSLALLHILLQLRDEFNLTLHVATFDHGIRGMAGMQDVEFVREIAAKWGVPVTTGAADVPALALEWHMGLEEAARKARYDFLGDVVDTLKAQAIATGHNQDDQAETVLLHLIRGSGLAGLRGMLPRSHPSNHIALIRPLLSTSRVEIDEYMRDLGIQPRVDATNIDIHYTRNRIRHAIIPLLAEINPQVLSALARTAEMLSEDYAALSQLKPSSTDRAKFLELPAALQKISIRDLAQHAAPDVMITQERLESALQTARNGGKIELGGNLWFIATTSEVSVRANPTLPYPADCPSLPSGTIIRIEGAGTYQLPDAAWQMIVENVEPDSAVHPLSAILAIKANHRVILRTRLPGDIFRPAGLNAHSQKLKETLINIKIPAEWRDQAPLLVVDDEIAWFVAPTEHGPVQRVSHSFAPTPHDPHPRWRFRFLHASIKTTF